MCAANGTRAGEVRNGVDRLVDVVGSGALSSVGSLRGLGGGLLLAGSAVDLLGDGGVVTGATGTSTVGADFAATALDLAGKVSAKGKGLCGGRSATGIARSTTTWCPGKGSWAPHVAFHRTL